MPREIEKHDDVIRAFSNVDIVSELVEQLPNGEFRNELDMDIILFGRSYRGKKVGPYARLLEFAPGEVILSENTWESSLFYILVAGRLEASIAEPSGGRKVLGEVPPGNSFGEMALLSGTPRTATVSVADDAGPATVLEFSRPAIRLLRKLPKFGRSLDRNYRDYGQRLAIGELRAMSGVGANAEVFARLDDASRFAVYEKDHVLFREGDPINRVFYVRSGWIQRVSGVEFNPRAADLLIESDASVGVDLVGAGNCLGLEAVAGPTEWRSTATVRGRAEVVEIAVSRLREDAELARAVVPFLAKFGEGRPARPERTADGRVLAAAAKEIETGVVDGVNLLVMDMAKCVRCGNCSLACHKVHGRTRLVRRGIHIERPKRPMASLQSVLVPSVCMHCRDPECLTGCPTGAIARYPNGEIDIEPKTCIGCGDCATQCPYNAISMVARGPETNGGGLVARTASLLSLTTPALPEPVEETEKLVAVKCNLCNGTGLNPPGAARQAYSCEENCPTGALVRVDPREYFDEIGDAVGLVGRDAAYVPVVNLHKFDAWAMIWHIVGVLLVVAGGGAALWATLEYTQDTALLPGGWLTMRWTTGLAGLAAIVWVMLYPLRKQVYRRRAGALRYWMLSHVYLGVLGGIVLLVHGGTSSGSLLTTALMLSFDLVILSGLLGLAAYVVLPRFMTRIEREPLLVEDLEARRLELRSELLRTARTAENADVRRLVETRVRRRFLGLGYLLRQYLRREDLQTMLADARREFRAAADKMHRRDDALLMEAVENAATLRRVDALLYLHAGLKFWLAPHVLFSSAMLVLMAIHIIQAVYFNVR